MFGVTFLGAGLDSNAKGNFKPAWPADVVAVVTAARAQEQAHLDFFTSLGGKPLTQTFNIPDPALLTNMVDLLRCIAGSGDARGRVADRRDDDLHGDEPARSGQGELPVRGGGGGAPAARQLRQRGATGQQLRIRARALPEHHRHHRRPPASRGSSAAPARRPRSPAPARSTTANVIERTPGGVMVSCAGPTPRPHRPRLPQRPHPSPLLLRHPPRHRACPVHRRAPVVAARHTTPAASATDRPIQATRSRPWKHRFHGLSCLVRIMHGTTRSIALPRYAPTRVAGRRGVRLPRGHATLPRRWRGPRCCWPRKWRSRSPSRR